MGKERGRKKGERRGGRRECGRIEIVVSREMEKNGGEKGRHEGDNSIHREKSGEEEG